MVTPAQRKGDSFERAILAFLKEEGITAYRQHDGGSLDTGDFVIGPFVVQAKAFKDTVRGLREGMSGAEIAANRLPGHIPAVLVKREGYGIGAAYFVLSLRSLVTLLERLEP